MDDEMRKKISVATKKAMSAPEIREKISVSKAGKPSPRKGVKLTPEQKQKLSESHKKKQN